MIGKIVNRTQKAFNPIREIGSESLSLKITEKVLKRLTKLSLILIVVFGFFGATVCLSQNQRRIIQLSGIILSEDSVSGLPGAHIYVPKAGRGTTSNSVGFFSMPVLVGDSVVISSIGYERRHYIIPGSANEYLTIIVEMVQDLTYLKEIEILPFPTEEVFKQAVLALNIPLNENGLDKRNLNAQLLALMLQSTPMDGAANYRYYMDQYPSSINNKFQPITNPFLNVVNWAKFFKSMKDKKK